MNSIFYLSTISSFSNNAMIESIISECNKLTLEEGLIGYEDKPNKVSRRSQIAFFEDRNIPLNKLMYNIATEVNEEHFGFDINNTEHIQYSVYDENDNGKYDWHTDTNFLNNNFTQRKLSIILQLSEPTDYEGGQLELDVNTYGVKLADDFKRCANQKGAIIVFPSFIRHRVTPVTKGIRKSLITWVTGPNFK
tara:strand:+ start:59 stop:637 length:579 start_codon:yes stop_codon:yes gene_type:complete